MVKRRRKNPEHSLKPNRPEKLHGSARLNAAPNADATVLYQQAQAIADRGELDKAWHLYQEAERLAQDSRLKARLRNDLAVLSAVAGDFITARKGFETALAIDPQYGLAQENLDLLATAPVPGQAAGSNSFSPVQSAPTPSRKVKVAVASFLFNWPSSGGGNIHTVELVKFLGRAGYEVRHYYARYALWQIGQVEHSPTTSECLHFTGMDWTIAGIQNRYRRAVDHFNPDFVIITDCWNFKPHLAAAFRRYRTLLRFQALECLCPLNNIRLLAGGNGQWRQCPQHQLATPAKCQQCLLQNAHELSGPLHTVERDLSEVKTDGYHALLLRCLMEADAVLVLNPMAQALLSPYSRRVEVVTWGMDPARFPWPAPAEPKETTLKTIFQAGVIDEPMKGFAVLHAACAKLWQKRQDFRLVVTGQPVGSFDAFTTFIGWITQDRLPRYYRAADLVAVPTVAQEGLSRTSVEAMASGKAVLASRIGGLPFSVDDGATGLLCEPGNVDDWSEKLNILLTDDYRREAMGRTGRKQFEERFVWDKVIERCYRPLLNLEEAVIASK